MADRVKYFLLGLLFLVVAGVIAYDRWNSRDGLPEDGTAEYEMAADKNNASTIFIGPGLDENGATKERPHEEPPSVDEELELVDAPPFRGDGLGLGKRNGDHVIKEEPQPQPRPQPTPAARTHVVRSGEALEKIARLYYEPGEVYKGIQLIVKANSIANPNRISKGDKLVIPAMSSGARPTVDIVRTPNRKATASKPATKKKSGGIPSVYVVRASDGDLYKILRRFYGRSGEGARIVRVMEANNLVSVNVKAGTRIKMPNR